MSVFDCVENHLPFYILMPSIKLPFALLTACLLPHVSIAAVLGFDALNFSTGYNLSVGADDPNYQITLDASGGSVPRAATLPTPFGGWITTGLENANWISINANATTSHSVGAYTYISTQSFTATGDDSITFQAAVDNSVTISLLGNPSYTQTQSINTFDAFTSLHTISFTNILAGSYQLVFDVENAPGPDPNPTGLLVIAPVPEPTPYAILVGLALGAVLLRARERRTRIAS